MSYVIQIGKCEFIGSASFTEMPKGQELNCPHPNPLPTNVTHIGRGDKMSLRTRGIFDTNRRMAGANIGSKIPEEPNLKDYKINS